MYGIDTAIALLASITCTALAFSVIRGKRVGGLTFCKLGRFGFCFYFSKPVPVRRSLPVVGQR